MSGPSKVSGNMTATAGSIKESVGRMVGSAQMQAEGAAKRTEGNAEIQAAKTQGYTEGAVDSMGGSIKKHAGSAIGNEGMQARGAATEASGEAKKAANNY
ncbi:hypothetical protein HK104_003206 [Borealophlyctis nickersoniae]|nr:hypothetical protein HK104_003206 [Borealophlyctis nickersoniae]